MIANRSVTANFVPTGTGGTGTILREYWLNVTGGTVASLTSNSAYPSQPDRAASSSPRSKAQPMPGITTAHASADTSIRW